MQFNSVYKTGAAVLCAIVAIALASCGDGGKAPGTTQDADYNEKLLVSEIMTDNLTTITDADGRTSDWIEITNISDGKVSLDGMSLYLPAEGAAKAAPEDEQKDEANKDKEEKAKDSADAADADAADADVAADDDAADQDAADRWFFPDVDLEPGAHLVVFLNKKGGDDEREEAGGKREEARGGQPITGMLTASLKLPSDSGHVMLLTSRGTILSDIKYGELATDEALCQNADGTLYRTRHATPGHPNTEEGLLAFMAERDAACTDGLKIWEVKANGSSKGEQWVEVKNTSQTDIRLAEYCLTNKAGKPDKWSFPDVVLAPGEFFTVQTMGRKAVPGAAPALKKDGVNAPDDADKQGKKGKKEEAGGKKNKKGKGKKDKGKKGKDKGDAAESQAAASADKPLAAADKAPADEASAAGDAAAPADKGNAGATDKAGDGKKGKKKDKSKKKGNAAGGKKGKGQAKVAPFKLSGSNGVALTKDGKFVDGMSAGESPIGASRGRIEGQKGFFYFSVPSQNAENPQKGCRFVASQPTLSRKGGLCQEAEVTVEIDGHGQKVHYTTDGTLPTVESPLYSNPLKFKASTTLRYMAEGDADHLPSAPATATYLFGANHSLPVLHVTVRHEDLFNPYSGIYVEGGRPARIQTRKIGGAEVHQNNNANYLQPWVKPAYAEFFDGKEGFAVSCGIKIFGAGSRHLEKKSLMLKFDAAYGSDDVVYDFFDTGEALKLDNLVLRSGSTDANGVMVRDEFFTSLMAAECPTALTQAYRPIVLYVNHEYWGIFFFREKTGDDFVARHLGVSKDNVDIMLSQHVEEGSAADYNAIHAYVRSHDMKTDEAFNWVDERVSLTSLIDYKMGQMYSGNTDIYNVREVRANDPDGDQKWYYILYDLDESFISKKPMGFYLRAGFPNSTPQPVSYNNLLIDRMLDNAKFRRMFLERLAYHAHKTFSPERATANFDKIIKLIEPEMERNCQRWPSLTYTTWQSNVKRFREQIQTRTQIVVDGVKAELKVTDAEARELGL